MPIHCSFVEPLKVDAFRNGGINYIHHEGTDDIPKRLTMWVIADFGSRFGQDLVREVSLLCIIIVVIIVI